MGNGGVRGAEIYAESHFTPLLLDSGMCIEAFPVTNASLYYTTGVTVEGLRDLGDARRMRCVARQGLGRLWACAVHYCDGCGVPVSLCGRYPLDTKVWDVAEAIEIACMVGVWSG
jgi:hypothetical protein